jgi:hypothetical protein
MTATELRPAARWFKQLLLWSYVAVASVYVIHGWEQR